MAPLVLADGLFLGHDLLAWLVLAVAGALVVGNLAALLRPSEKESDVPLPTGFRRRASILAVVGAIAALWALATLTT